LEGQAKPEIPNMHTRLHFAEVDESQLNDDDNDDFPDVKLHQAFKALNLNPENPRYLGWFSTQLMIRKVIHYTKSRLGAGLPYDQAPALWMPSRRDWFWNILPVCRCLAYLIARTSRQLLSGKLTRHRLSLLNLFDFPSLTC
jgi:hypothetical protein